MEQTYLVALIQTLSKEEKAGLELFLLSPYFNTSANRDRVNLLYGLLIQEQMKKEEVYAHIFPDTSWISGKLDKLMSELSGLIRQFLLSRYYLDDSKEFSQALDWAIIVRERGLHNRYAQYLGKAESLLEQKRLESKDHYFHQFQLAFEKHLVESRYNRLKGDLSIPETIDSLDAYYLAYRIELQNLLLLQQKLTRIELPQHLTLHYPEFIPREAWAGSILLNVSTKINEQLTAETASLEAFKEILELLQAHDQQIAPVPLQNFYAYLRNLCILLIQQGQTSFTPVLHDIQRDNLQRGYLFLHGKLSPSAYMSVARTANLVGKSDWALNFIESYKDLIMSEEDAENFYLFNKAECLFAMSRFEEALEILPQSFSDLIYLTNCKRLEIKLYYELNSDLLSYKIDAFKMFISRASKKVLADYVREMEGSFVNMLLQIVQCPPGDPDKIARIIKRIQEKKVIHDREWLLEKAQQLR